MFKSLDHTGMNYYKNKKYHCKFKSYKNMWNLIGERDSLSYNILLDICYLQQNSAKMKISICFS